MKANAYYKIHKKLQVHSTNICRFGEKKKYRQVATNPLPLTLTVYLNHNPKVGLYFFR